MIKGIVFDIGGVITNDVWESIYYDSEIGIINRYHISREELQQIGEKLWSKYSILDYDENDLEIQYWRDFKSLTGLEINQNELVEITDKLIVELEGIDYIIQKLLHNNYVVGLCSDNTKFWFTRQCKKSNALKLIDSKLSVISYQIGENKSDSNLVIFKRIIQKMRIDKESILYIDDRVPNIEKALSFGIKSILFPSHSNLGHKYLNYLFYELNIF